ncbi:MAG: HNH endonuclease signature motif containing protein [Pseudomonadota bacterium]
MLEKPCSTCQIDKPLSEFYTDNRRPDGRASRCKLCHRKVQRHNPKTQRAWYQKNRERLLDQAREYRAKNPGHGYLRLKQWRHRNVDACRAQDRQYKALRDSPDLRLATIARDGSCLRCGSVDDLCLDHILPISMGGITSFDNLQTLCQSCNLRKRSTEIDFRDKI